VTLLEKVRAADMLIRQALSAHGRVCVASSFGKDSVALLHLLIGIRPGIPVVNVLMDTEFAETVAFSRAVAKRWALNYHEHHAVQGDVPIGECCGAVKVAAFREALQPYDVWFSGVRVSEGITRADFQPVETVNGLTKINPILDWSELDVWRYTATRGLPVHPLYALGYRSLGCARCSTPELDPGEPERAGRWPGTDRCECGIHTQALR
jgi:phosphoadenosine phosphosulfate reductase